MTINERIKAAITPIVPVCIPGEYDGEETEYCTFRCNDQPDVFAEGRPDVIVHMVLLNWHLPKNRNSMETKRRICRALEEAGFTYPYVEDLSDTVSQRYLFECEFPGEVG